MNFRTIAKELSDWVAEVTRLPVIDTHEHLMPIAVRNQMAADFSYLFNNYLRPEFISAGMTPSEVQRFYSSGTDEEEKIRLFLEYWPRFRNTSFARLKRQAAHQIFGVEEFTAAGLRALGEAIRGSARPDWYEEQLEGSGIEIIVLNYLKTHRLLGWSEPDDPMFFAAANFDDFVWIASPGDVQELEKEFGQSIEQLDDLLEALRRAFRSRIGPQVCIIKSVLAYFRTLEIEEPNRDAAERIFARLLQEPEREFDFQLRGQDVPWARPFQDFVLHEIFRRAGEVDLAVQLHIGYQAGNGNVVTNADPANLIPVFFRHPQVRFELLHVGYPFHLLSLTLAKMFPNVWINFSWFFALAPTAAADALQQSIELVPASKVTAFGGDYRLIEGTIIHLQWTRERIAQELGKRILERYWTEEEASDYARRILYTNPKELYRLSTPHPAAGS